MCIPACIRQGGCVSQHALDMGGVSWRILWDAINNRAVRIPLECILVFHTYHTVHIFATKMSVAEMNYASPLFQNQ